MASSLRRLGALFAVLFFTASAAPPSALDEGSVVIVRPDRLLFHDRIDAIDPSDPNGAITEWAYDAQFTVVSRLAGPDLGPRPRILYVDQRGWRDTKLLMIVRRDGRGRLWARRAWQEVGPELCLSAQQVSKLGLYAAFARARDNGGERCIRV